LKASLGFGTEVIAISNQPETKDCPKNLPQEWVREEIRDATKINADALRRRLSELVRSTAEDTLNEMLNAEASELCKAK
jgi:hypothetical protein